LCESKIGIKFAKNLSTKTAKHIKTIGCFFETIGCLYQQSLKQKLKEFRVRERDTPTVYTGSLLSQELHPVMDLCLLFSVFEVNLRKLHELMVEQGSHVESWTP